MNFVLVLLFILVIFIINNSSFIENFNIYQTAQSYIPVNSWKFPISIPIHPWTFTNQRFPWFNQGLPWFNSRFGNTRNMSYDLRGDPLIIPRNNFVWNNSTVFPIYNAGI